MTWRRYKIIIEAEVEVQNYPAKDLKNDLRLTLPGSCLENKKVLVLRLDGKKGAKS